MRTLNASEPPANLRLTTKLSCFLPPSTAYLLAKREALILYWCSCWRRVSRRPCALPVLYFHEHYFLTLRWIYEIHKATCTATVKLVWFFSQFRFASATAIKQQEKKKKNYDQNYGNHHGWGKKLIAIGSRSSTLNKIIAGINYRTSSPPGSIWVLLTGITEESSSLGLWGQGPPQGSSLPSASPRLLGEAPTTVLRKGATKAHGH